MVKSAVRESSPWMSMQRKSIHRRKATLKKKAEELAILCDAEVCMVISDGQAAAVGTTTEVIWPEDPATAKAIMIKYKESSKRKREVGVSDLVGSKRKRSVVVEEEKKKEELGCTFGTMWDEELDQLSVESLMALSRAVGSKIESVDERIRLLEGKAAIQVNYDHNEDDPLIPDDFDFYSELDAMLKEFEENHDHHDPIVFNHNTYNNLPLGFEEAHDCSNVCAPMFEISRFEAADDNFGLLGVDANFININHDDEVLVPNWDDVQPRMMGFNQNNNHHHQYYMAAEVLAQPSPSPLLEALPMAFWPQRPN